jgi:hypothetical protein
MPIYVELLDKAHDIKKVILDNLKNRHGQKDAQIFVYPHDENEEEQEFINEILGDSSEVKLVDKRNNSQDCITHFEGLVKPVNKPVNVNIEKSAYSTIRDIYVDLVKKGELQIDPKNGVLVLDPEVIKNDNILQNKIWDLCISRFNDLEEGLPFNQGFDKDEFFKYILFNPTTTTIIHKTDGELDCVATFMHDIKNAPWLNANFYNERYGDELLSYFVLIAKAQEASGRLSMELISMLMKLAQKAKRNVWVTFECTNISAEYVPKIVSMAVNSSKTLKIDINQVAHYTIRLFKVKNDSLEQSLSK